MYIFNLVIVIPSSINRIVITTKVPNIVEKDKEEHSYITVSNIKLSLKMLTLTISLLIKT